MKKLVNYISIALLTWIAFGCTDEQIVNHTGTELRVTGEIESPSRTIYTETDKAVTVSWAAGDRIGLFSEEQPEAMAYQAASEGNYQAELALKMFAYRVKKYIGAYAAAMGGADILLFTGGIGENDAVLREWICQGLSFMGVEIDKEKNASIRGKDGIISANGSKVTTLVAATDEERVIATDTIEIIRKNA